MSPSDVCMLVCCKPEVFFISGSFILYNGYRRCFSYYKPIRHIIFNNKKYVSVPFGLFFYVKFLLLFSLNILIYNRYSWNSPQLSLKYITAKLKVETRPVSQTSSTCCRLPQTSGTKYRSEISSPVSKVILQSLVTLLYHIVQILYPVGGIFDLLCCILLSGRCLLGCDCIL